MKLSKVLLSSAVAAALVFGFAGCKTNEDEDGNVSKVLKITDGSYKVTLKASADATSGTSKTISTANTLSSFVVQEAKLGKYAMVQKDANASGTWTFPKDSYIRAANTEDSDVMIWDGEIHN